MAHRLRNIQPDVVYEAVRRTRRGRYAFVPSPALNAELAGVIGEAQKRWPQVRVHQWQWLSTHFHALISATGPHAANAVVDWENFIFGESAKVAQAINGLTGEIWEKKRCRLIPILDDTMLRARTKYIMAQAVDAGLVPRPRDWPGLNTSDVLCRGRRLRGYRGTAALRRRARRDRVPMASIAPRFTVRISALPSQAALTVAARQRWYREIEREIIEEAAVVRAGRRYPPPACYTTINPETTQALEESPAPRCWAAPDNHEARRAWCSMVEAFTLAWRAALAAWVEGARACFPRGGWVPFGACHSPGYVQRE